MPDFRFDPPLTLKGNIVVRNLDDAVRFMIGYREARRIVRSSETVIIGSLPNGHVYPDFRNRLKDRTTPGSLELDETVVLCSASSAISLQSFAR